jgi:hypothetical protein
MIGAPARAPIVRFGAHAATPGLRSSTASLAR